MKRLSAILCLLLAALPAMAQEFIGCRIDSGWAETPMLRRTFAVSDSDLIHYDFQTVRFSVEVTSLGYHEVYVNGRQVGDHVMQPAVSQLDKRALTVSYDITEQVREGDNEIMLWIGQGWGRVYGTPAAARARVLKTVYIEEIRLIDYLARTDSTWEASPSGYSYTGNWQPMHFGGERYDARVRPDWRPAEVYEAEGIAVSRQEFEGNRIIDELTPISGTVQPDGSLLLDFGRVVTGWFQARMLPVPEGNEVTMEYLDHIEAMPTFTETDIYVSDGDSGHFTNRFHKHAFRYVRIRGLNPFQLSIFNFRVKQISAVDPMGGATFECSDPRLNAIHDMVKYTLSCLTFGGYMVDCPHIERMGYGGDGNSSTMTLQTLWDVRDTYRNWLTAWGDAMDSTGDLPYVAPAFRTGGGPYWSGFIIKAPWRTYLNYGDSYLIHAHYDKMVRWLDFVSRHCEDGILQPWPDTERRSWFLGDWAVPEGVDKGGESVLHVSNCFLAECLADMVRMARMMGRGDDAERFAAWRERLVADIHRHFYHPETHTYANGTVLDQCYALLTLTEKNEGPRSSEDSDASGDSGNSVRDIMDSSGDSVRDIMDSVRARLIEDIHGKYRDHIAVGLVGLPVFTEWCIRERKADLMATLLRQEDYPGYLYMIEHSKLEMDNLAGADDNSQFSIPNSLKTNSSAFSDPSRVTETKDEKRLPHSDNFQFSILNSQFTTTWESWDCGRPGKEDRSRVHNCYNGIGLWFYQALAGIRPALQRPGYWHFFIDPQPVEGVEWVRATKHTPYGTIRVEIGDGEIKVVIPEGTTATLFPGTPKEQTLGSGEHVFSR